MSLAQVSAHIILIVTYSSGCLAANLPDAGTDGWYSWRVDVVDAAPELCCFTWNNGIAAQKRCNLDGRHGGFNSTDNDSFPSDEIQIYALMNSGTPTKIRVLSSQCPVTSDSAIIDLGLVDVDTSVAWLRPHVSVDSGIGGETIAAVALHAGDGALQFLRDTAASNANGEHREDAIFWMAQVRIAETANEIRKIMFDDRSATIREHAAFSYAQSSAADRAAMLIRQGKEDADTDVRSQAWFWLAQIEADESEREIGKALVTERDPEVREQAVFALSQLPEDRAVKALADVLEDSRLDIEIREEALFWLAQTESDEAFEYVERLLTDN